MRSVPVLPAVALGLGLALLLGGCQTSSTRAFTFLPRPQSVLVAGPPEVGTIGRAVIVVIGSLKADASTGMPESMHVRLVLENRAQRAIAFVPGQFRLRGSDLIPFGEPRLVPPEPPEVLPGAETTVDVYFPVPEGRRLSNLDLSGLDLRFSVAHESSVTDVTASFERIEVQPYAPYPYPYAPWGYPYVYYDWRYGW
jgi:hypothetical protein